ncbi:MAG: hypothetical protein J6I38_06180 [Prevotella sp.]|nr:hypothetical protein [Prevotella sp.]
MKRLYTRVFTFLLTLLLLGGTASVAWAKTVTYHILTKPFTVMNWDGTDKFHEKVRVEALQCTSDEETVGLPDQFVSPLATGFKYWGSATSTYGKLYDSGHGAKIIGTQYYLYDCRSGDYACFGDELSPGASVGDCTDIYVTYDYDNSQNILKLDGGTAYNISMNSKGVQKMLCFNRSRNNRVASANDAALSGEELASDEFVVPANDKKQLGWNWSKWGPPGIFSGFKFTGEDPYNITIMTSYLGPELHITDKITNVDGNGTVKPYAGSTLMCKVDANSMWFDVSNNRHYKISSGITDYSKWTPEKYKECWDAYYADGAAQYDTWNGFYRYESPTLNAFALLPNLKNGGYMFVGSKMNQNKIIYQPNDKGEYYTYLDNYDNDGGGRSQPYFKKQAFSAALSTTLYEIKSYTVHVTTKGSSTPLTATMKWSDARLSDNPADHVPEALRRKYVTYTAYSDAEHNNPVTTFKQIQDANNGMHIYLDYTVSANIPFETLPEGGNFENARWYTMRMDGVANPKYIAYEGTSNSLVVTNGSGAAKGSNTASQVHQGESSAEAMVAFMGDPYELKILNRKACESASANRFIGCATSATEGTGLTTGQTGSSDISKWEIGYESTGEDGFLLRQFNTIETPKYIGLGSDANNKPVTYSATSTRIKVVELEKVKYTYHIVRNDAGDIAVKASDTHDIAKKLRSWTDIPNVIRSPFLKDATVAYYGTINDAKNQTNAITNAPYGSERDIYVRYSVSVSGGTYNVRLNNDYIYTTDAGDEIKNKAMLDESDATTPAYQWYLDYKDPYKMTIKNSGKGKYVNVAFSDAASITWSDTPSYFVAKSGALPGTYEVMAATGDAEDASTVYYNIGRPTANTVKLYSQSSYQYGNDVLRFQLIGTDATRVVYHLIDKAGKDLLQATTRQTTTDVPSFPPEFHSPLVSSYHYYIESNFDKVGDTYTLKSPAPAELATVSGNSNIYVTYDVNDLINLKSGQLYLLKYEAGEEFHQEDGSDGVNPTAQKAVYPYVNGDGNFFVYGNEQYDLQQEGAASTRTRWAWYVQSNIGGTKGDPYHVTIRSRQSESYPITNSSEYNAYFMTYKPDDYSEVVTTLAWPGMSSETATEYMVLGSEGQYQLVTSYPINGLRYVVNSFEQYWKTYDTVRRKLLKQPKKDYPDRVEDPITVPETPCVVEGFDNNRTYLETSPESGGMGFHHYAKWAYAKRWNGHNNGYSNVAGTPETKKGWETIEHWFQTVDMGQGYFDFVKTSIDPVLILLDQHGWEIMRKPLPSNSEDPKKEEKYAAIRPYNSPMVKEYAFWATAKKRTGLHQYYLLSDRVGGENFTSTDLTNLPPYGSANVLDKKGNLNDQYVTYIVKDEFAQTYQPGETPTAKPFLIEQGTDHKYATTNGSTISATAIPGGDMKAHILNGNIPDIEKWYVKPNATIDNENGYNDVSHNWDAKTPNAYEDNSYSGLKTAVYIKETDEYKNADAAGKKALTDKFGQFSFSNGFDPYNIQIESVSASKFMKTNSTGAMLEEGSMIGTYSDSPAISLGDNTTIISPKPKWYDSRNLDVTNATFMAVQDAEGNMQLMPRFDHALRMSEFGTLIPPTDDNVSKTYTKLYRPEVYEYLIIDNDGHESLRYKTGGDLTPQIPDHFQSPLATNFTYYATATESAGVYSNLTDEIEESLDGVTLTGNKIYVRYEYDDEADDLNMLKGNWLTMQLNEKDAIEGIKQGTSKPSTIDSDAKTWQWKFTKSPQSTPDPYALYIFNRNQSAGTEAIAERFALLSHSAGDYALAKAGKGDYTYQFLNGDGMDASTAATIATETGFTPTSGSFDGTKSQVKLTDEVQHTFTYKVYTNGGVNAIDASQTQDDVHNNDWKPVLPEAARTPLLNMDQYLYYELSLQGAVAENDTLGKTLSTLYGLYGDIVYTHYTPYNAEVSTYLVPNERNATNVDPVARGINSNDAAVGLDGKRLYNIFWHKDNIMKSNGMSITSEKDKEIQETDPYEWEFEGNDPYAIKIKNIVSSTVKYIHKASDTGTDLNSEATPFMLLNKDGYDYGVFAITGDANTMLTGYGNQLTTSDPTKFIPFALSTFKVVYHLMIKNIGEDVIIPYKGPETNNQLKNDYKIKVGTTLRDLVSVNPSAGEHVAGDGYQLGSTLNGVTYCYDAHHVSLGDAFEVPQAFYRPNVSYDFYIEGVYTHNTDYSGDPVAELNDLYKGLKMTKLADDERLLGKIVWVNIVYNFMGGLDTNSGSDFVESVTQNKWYTFETNDATPMLAEYTGSLQTKSGYATHYTNDYLWTPVGDPYGFKMYNRYLYKNLGQNKVMSTSAFTTGTPITMVDDNETKYLPANSVYELLSTSTTTPGYFRIRPVVNMHDDTKVYMNNNTSTGAMTLSTTPTEWTFGLSEDVMRPYYQAAGYVGGLNAAGKAAYEAAVAETDPSKMLNKLMNLQDVVYNHDKADNDADNYIVHYTPGYYRLHNQPGSSDISTPRYASGYTHKIELTAGDAGSAIPMHFYEVEDYGTSAPVFTDLGTAGTDYSNSAATRGDLPLQTVTNDPASIFYFYQGTAANPTTKIQTQGLYVNGNKMTATDGSATSFKIIDIGAGVVALQGGDNFLKYAQDVKKYDLKFDNTASTIESTRWCMKPVQKSATAGEGEMELRVKTNNGGDNYYYTTFCAPFDVLMTNERDVAYVIPPGEWPTLAPPTTTKGNLYPKEIGEYNTSDYASNNQFIPAGTPVIIRTSNPIGYVTMALPTSSPSSSVSCLFTGKYLEQMLTQGADDVYVFGRDLGTYTKASNYSTTGQFSTVIPSLSTGIGFYINANPNREASENKASWTRNNKYVYANKIYYRAGSSGASTRGVQFVPVVFGAEAEATDVQGVKDYSEGVLCPGNVYNLQGRCVATEEMVKDGTWKNNLTPGVYIMSGKKIIVK